MTTEQRQDKINELYNYMTGKEFHQRVSGIIEATVDLDRLINQEIRSHQRHWGNRKKLHERVMRQTAQLYGEIAGIVGTLPPVPQLELPAAIDELAEAPSATPEEDEDIPF